MKSKVTHRLAVGTAEDCPDIEYASGFKPVDATDLLVSGRNKALVVPGLEYGRACEEAAGADVFTPQMLKLKPRARGRVGGWAAALLKKYGIKHVTVSPTLYHAVAKRLERSGSTYS